MSVLVAVTKKVIVDGEVTKVIKAAASSTVTSTTFAFNGSDMTGNDGDTGRTYTHTSTISSYAKVYVGSLGGGLMRLDSSKWSSAGAVLTIGVAVYDGDRVNVDQ